MARLHPYHGLANIYRPVCLVFLSWAKNNLLFDSARLHPYLGLGNKTLFGKKKKLAYKLIHVLMDHKQAY